MVDVGVIVALVVRGLNVVAVDDIAVLVHGLVGVAGPITDVVAIAVGAVVDVGVVLLASYVASPSPPSCNCLNVSSVFGFLVLGLLGGAAGLSAGLSASTLQV